MWDRLSAHVPDLNGLAVLDILILAALIYQILLLIRGSRAVHMIVGVVAVLVLHVLTRPGLLYLPAVHAVLGDLLLYIPLAIIVLFQNQLRQVLTRVGRNPLVVLRGRGWQLVEESRSPYRRQQAPGPLMIRRAGLRVLRTITLDASSPRPHCLVFPAVGAAPRRRGRFGFWLAHPRACAHLPDHTPTCARSEQAPRRDRSLKVDAIAIVVSEQRGACRSRGGGSGTWMRPV
jgi:diadenylate cyclase